MKISLNWLKEFVEIPKNTNPEKLGLALTLKTVEVEGIEKQGENLENVVIGKIKKIANHPNADKLKICFVDIGDKKDLQIVCGGINLREGMFTAVAKVGAKVRWHGEGDLAELKKVKFRGIESNGMICASSELGIENIIKQENEAEIVDLEKYKVSSIQYKAGKGLDKVLGMDDVIFDIDNKSLTHRPDLWSHYGIAREISSIFNFQFSIFNNKKLEILKSVDDKIKINVDVKDTDLCPRYMAVAMSGIKIEPSPQWMQNRLFAVGMRPINNIVDITNYAMLELGQPMHAFDISKLKSQNSKLKKIIVRRAGQGEKIKTLDGVERELDNTMLVIADSEKPIAIAGVIGGENSEIDKNTTEIILESANFDKVNNRKTSSKLGLRTEAVMRYEKGLDPFLTEKALARSVELILEIIPSAVVASDVADVETRQCPVPNIEITLDYIKRKIGVEIGEKRVVDILESLGFGVEVKSFNTSLPPAGRPIKGGAKGLFFKITVPSWRATGDISSQNDIIEEIARIYGYDDIKPEMPKVNMEVPLENREKKLERKIKNILSFEFGMAETSNYSFVSEKALKEVGWDANECVKLSNPLSSDFVFLRPSLVLNLLENARKNLRYFDEFKMFEIGNVFKDEKGDIKAVGVQNFEPLRKSLTTLEYLPWQEKFVAGIAVGVQNFEPLRKSLTTLEYLPWQEKFVAGIMVAGKNETLFYKVKEVAEGLLQELNIDYSVEQFGEIEESWMRTARSAKLKVKSIKLKVLELGYITELSPVIAENMGIKNARVALFNLSLKSLLELACDEKKYKELPKYPSVIRDLAIIVNKEILYKDIVEIIAGIDPLIKSVKLFDIFESEKIGADKKSMAFRIIFQSDERTLTDGEVENVWKKLVSALKDKLKAEARM